MNQGKTPISEQYLLSLIFVTILSFQIVVGEKIEISNNGPVIFGSNITFTANLTNTHDKEFKWIWEDNYKPPHKIHQTAKNTSNITLSYDQPGRYVMKLEIKDGSERKAEGDNHFEITAVIPGTLEIYQYGKLVPRDQYLSCRNETVLVTKIHDPSDYFSKANINYIWNINNNIVIGENGPNLTRTFDEPKDWNVLVVATAYLPDGNRGKYVGGSFSTTVKSRAPIDTINVTGKVVLKHGDLVDLQVDCDGSNPWSYCWMAVPEINGSQIEDAVCSEVLTTNDCQFKVIYYFRKSGHHEMLLNISNDVNRVIKRQGITIYTAVPEPQLSTVIIPVVCSLLAIAIVLIGIFSYAQSRRQFHIEVADFDFTSADSFSYQTFCQQLKEAFASLRLPGSSSCLCEREWNFLDCGSKTESDAPMEDEFRRDFCRRDRLVESADDESSIREFINSN
uniref:PKD domain-containing protein n=1 Tax=Strigamia maritima TaxID=126957 RepID=T1J417_STRMM